MELGQVAYEAYVLLCGGYSVNGDALGAWHELAPELRAYWRGTANAVEMFLEMRKAPADLQPAPS